MRSLDVSPSQLIQRARAPIPERVCEGEDLTENRRVSPVGSPALKVRRRFAADSRVTPAPRHAPPARDGRPALPRPITGDHTDNLELFFMPWNIFPDYTSRRQAWCAGIAMRGPGFFSEVAFGRPPRHDRRFASA